MKVLITGGCGYFGSMLTAHLIRQGHEVTVFDKCLFGAQPLIVFSNAPFRLIQGDIRDAHALFSAMRGMDAVVHLAAVVGEAACLLDPIAARSINLEGTELVLSLAQKCDVEKLVFISTCSNYGISLSNALTTEESPLNPLTEYATAKVLAEQAILKNDTPLTTTILRFGTICGLSPQMRFDLLVNELARSAALDQHMTIFAPDAWRPFLHIQDAARVIECCLQASHEKLKGKIFNVISENYQKKTLAHLVQKHYPSASLAVVDKSPDPRDYRVSGAKIEDDLGFVPHHTIEQAFLDIVTALRQKVFPNPFWPGFSAVPQDVESLKFN